MEAAGECHSVSSLDLWHQQGMQRPIDRLAWTPWANLHHNSARFLAVMLRWACEAFQADFWFLLTLRHLNVLDWNWARLVDCCLWRFKGVAARVQLMRMSCWGAGFFETPSEMASPSLLRARADLATHFLTKLQRLLEPAKRQLDQICCVFKIQAKFDVRLLPGFTETRLVVAYSNCWFLPFAVTEAFTFIWLRGVFSLH